MQQLELRAGVLLQEVGDMWVAFSAASGETHLLNNEAAAFLEILSESPRTLEQAAELIASESGLQLREVLPILEDAAATLEAVGLTRTIVSRLPGRAQVGGQCAGLIR